MAISVLQSNVGAIANSSGPLAVAFPSSNGSGNLLVASFWAINFSTISDSQGNTWVRLFVSGYTISGANQYIYYCLSSSPGANTVTLTFSGAGSYSGLVILEASGGTWTVDGTATGASGGGTALSSGTMSTTGTNDLLVSGTFNSGQNPVTPGTNWTTLQTDSVEGTTQYRIVTSAGSQISNATVGASTSWMIDIGAFTAAGSSGVNPTVSGTLGISGSPVLTSQYVTPISPISLTGVTAPSVGISISGSIGISGFVATTPFHVTGSLGIIGTVNPYLVMGGIIGSLGISGIIFPTLSIHVPPVPPTPVPHNVGLVGRFDNVISNIVLSNNQTKVIEASTGRTYLLQSIMNTILRNPQTNAGSYNVSLRFSTVEYRVYSGTISAVLANGQRQLLYTLIPFR